MNERIKELSKQAGCYYDGMGYGEGNIEKFAELIVKECASLFTLAYTDEQYQRRIDKTILKHFGFYE